MQQANAVNAIHAIDQRLGAIKADNEAQAIRAIFEVAEKKFDPEVFAAQLSQAKLLRINNVVGACLKQASHAIAPHLANPEVDPAAIATSLAQALQAFLMIGPRDAYEIAPAAFTRACETTDDLSTVSDVTIALCAFIKEGDKGAVTRNPSAARQWAESIPRNGTRPVRTNKGAYIVCTTVNHRNA